MRSDIKSLQQKLGITTIFVTHDQEEALTMSHKIAVFNSGQCIQIGTPNEIYSNPKNSFVANFIGNSNLFKINNASSNTKKIYLDHKIYLDIEEDFLEQTFISIRPEHINIKISASHRVNEFKGIIEDIQFNGNIIKYIVNLGNFKVKVTTINCLDEGNNFYISQEIYLEIPKKYIKLLKD